MDSHIHKGYFLSAHLGMIIVSLAGLLVVFAAVCIVCDEHLVPAVEVFIREYQMPEEVAAVTLVAFGSAAPEIMLNTVGAAEEDSSLSLPSVLGSAMIAFGLIPSAALLFSHHRALQIEVWPLLRETTFYLVGLFLFLKVIDDAVTELLEAVAMTSVYFVYVGTVVGFHLYNRNNKEISYSDEDESKARTLKASGMLELQQLGCSTPLDIADVNNNVVIKDSEAENTGNNVIKTLFSPDHHEKNKVEDEESNVPLLQEMNKNNDKRISDTPSADVSIEDELNNVWDKCATPIRALFSRIIPPLRPHQTSSDNLSSSSSASRSSRDGNQDNTLLDRLTSSFSPYKDEKTVHESSTSSAEVTDSDFFDDESHIHDRPEKPHRWLIGETTSSVKSIGSDGEKNGDSVQPTSSNGIVVPAQQNNESSENVSLCRAIVVLLTSILCVGILASCIIYFCADIAKLMGVDNSTLGATLVALGAEIPDTISAVSLSRSGFTHGAISGAIGSQVINISLGVGLPALLQCLTKKHMEIQLAKEDTTSLGLLVCLVFVVLASFILVTIPIQKILYSCQLPRFSHLNRYGALMLLLVWLASFLSFIVLN